MPTDPFVNASTQAQPRNEPTLAPGVVLPPARSWRAERPGDLPDGVQPQGALFGTPGPNVGYALRLVHRASGDFQLAPGEDRHDAEAVVAAVAMKRASSYGRGPTLADVDRAARLLGYRGGADAETVARRVDAVQGAHHEYARCRAVADQVDLARLRG
ncbi:MAG: hypothetical protein ACKOA9_06745 [Actinomycetota bacterium]